MQQLLRSIKAEQLENMFHLELHFTSVGFGKWFSVKDNQQDVARRLHEIASLIEMDLQNRVAQLCVQRNDGGEQIDSQENIENDRPKAPCKGKYHSLSPELQKMTFCGLCGDTGLSS